MVYNAADMPRPKFTTAAKPVVKKAKKVVQPKRVVPRAAKKADQIFAHDRQEALIEAAVVSPDNGPTRAMLIADGPVTLGEAARLLSTPSIAGEVLARRRTLAEEAGVTSVAVMRKLGAMGLSNMRDYVQVDEVGTPHFSLSNLTETQWAAIQEITTEEAIDVNKNVVRRTKIKLYPAEGSLEKLAKHLGIRGFGNKLEIVGRNGGPIELAAVAMLSEEEIDRQIALIESGDVDNESERTE